MYNRLFQALKLLHEAFVARAPKDSWNLALNGIVTVQDGSERYVVIGGELAPYAEYTNENWDQFQPPLKGKKNPNEGWIEGTIEFCLPMIEQIMSGTVSIEEINDWKKKNIETKLKSDYKQHLAKLEEQNGNIRAQL